MKRRSLLAAAAAAVTAAAMANPVAAQPLESVKTIRLTVGFPAGGSTDLLARYMAERLRVELDRNVIVMNEPGATGMLSIERLKRAPNDGSVISLIPLTSGVIFPMFRKKVDFDFQQDFEPIANMLTYPLAFSVPNQIGVDDLKGYIAWAKANSIDPLYGHGGTGSMAQMVGAMIGAATGLKMQEVPFRGGADVVNALVGGQIQGAVNVMAEVAGQYQAGRLKILAVSSKRRAPGLSHIPTFAELGYPEVDSEPWFAFFAPKGTPAPVIAALNKAINASLADPALRKRLTDQGFFIAGGTPEDLRALVAADAVRWRKIMDAAGFKALD